MLADSLYSRRDRVSATITLAIGMACVIVAVSRSRMDTVMPPPEKTLTVELTALTEPTSQRPSTPQTTKQVAPPPKTSSRTVSRTPPAVPQQQAAAHAVQPVLATQGTPHMVSPASSETSAHAEEFAAPALPHTAGETSTHAPAAPPPLPKGNADHAYEVSILALVEAHKVYPTGRQAMQEHPAGTARVCVTLSRSGQPNDARIAGSSGSMLLDQAARRLVASLSYPSAPDQAFAGQAQHEFCMSVEYQSPDN